MAARCEQAGGWKPPRRARTHRNCSYDALVLITITSRPIHEFEKGEQCRWGGTVAETQKWTADRGMHVAATRVFQDLVPQWNASRKAARDGCLAGAAPLRLRRPRPQQRRPRLRGRRLAADLHGRAFRAAVVPAEGWGGPCLASLAWFLSTRPEADCIKTATTSTRCCCPTNLFVSYDDERKYKRLLLRKI